MLLRAGNGTSFHYFSLLSLWQHSASSLFAKTVDCSVGRKATIVNPRHLPTRRRDAVDSSEDFTASLASRPSHLMQLRFMGLTHIPLWNLYRYLWRDFAGLLVKGVLADRVINVG